MPELWFLWHEIWGASLLAMAIDMGMFKLFTTFPNSFTFVACAAIFAGTRLAAGATAHQIFYARHGKWPHVDTDAKTPRE